MTRLNPTKFTNPDYFNEIEKNIKNVTFDNLTRVLYSSDASIYQIMPIGVIFPHNIDEVIAAVEINKKYSVPILPRGSGTSLAGQSVGEALIIDFKYYLNKIIEINPTEKYIITQPGAILGSINSELKQYGLMYGPDPASAKSATIGGVIGNNSTGAHFIEYGMTSDNILGLNLILENGRMAEFSGNKGSWEELKKIAGSEGEIYQKVQRVLKKYSVDIIENFPDTKRNVSGYAINLIDPNR